MKKETFSETEDSALIIEALGNKSGEREAELAVIDAAPPLEEAPPGIKGRGKAERKKEATSEPKEAKRIFGTRVSSLLIICYIAAFCGWLVENLFRLISNGIFDSRHQLLPFLAAYGFGIFVLFFVFGTPTEMRIFKKRILPKPRKWCHALLLLIYYVSVYVLIFFGEMGCGLLFEKVFGIRAWNYENIPTHVTRYTSLITTFGFTTGITLLMHFIFRPALRFFESIPQKVSFYIALILGILIAADWCVMIGSAVVYGHFPDYWSIRFW